MQIIPAKQNVPISIDLAANGLVAGMTVFDMTSGAPVQLVGQPGQTNNVYPMTNLGATNSYFAFFKGLPQKVYLLVFSQYADGTYMAAIGTTQSLTVAAKIMAPIFVQNLSVEIGCEDQPNQQPVVVSQVSDGSILLSFFDDNGNPVDITALTAMSVSILEADAVTILSKSLGSGISLVDGSINQALVEFLAADFALLPTGDNDVQVSISLGGVNNSINIYDGITIEPGIS